MKPKFWQTKRFKKLQKEWDERLERSGFKDAERRIGGQCVLRQRSAYAYRDTFPVTRENKQRYYELLGIYFHKEEFEDPVDRLVMDRRANGVKIRQICDELRSLNKKCHRDTIEKIVRKYEIKWGIRDARTKTPRGRHKKRNL